MHGVWPWIILFLLGCYHGVNPGMGWLFAVALGMQEKSSRAVLGAIIPIGIGHAVSIGLVVALAGFAELHYSHASIKIAAAAILFGFGAYLLIRSRHLRWVGMRVGFWGLALWAFIMASGHGAGLMLLPIVTHDSAMAGMNMPAVAPSAAALIGAVAVHTAGYLLVMTAIAFLVYEKLGLAMLRRGWLNFDLIWAVALIITGVVMLLV
jgi:multisubunit Na+/H+ antiporter MnhC subunit